MEITSTQNQRVKDWVKLHEKKHRDQSGLFLVEGEHLIQEAITSKRLECLIIEKGKSYSFVFDQEIIEVSTAVLAKLSQSKSGRNCMGVVRMEAVETSVQNKVIFLDGVQDPGNLGALLRSALAFGFDKVYLSKDCVDVYNDKVIRSTQGAMFHLAIERCDLLEAAQQLKEEGFEIFVTNLQAAKQLSETTTPKKLALVFGNEGQGVRKELITMATQNIIVEMATFESLNVAVAAGICMHYYFVQGNEQK